MVRDLKQQLQPIALVHKFAVVFAGRLEREGAILCDRQMGRHTAHQLDVILIECG